MKDAESLRATVIVPTTGDRGPLLEYSVGSALAQNVADIEVLIVGDGVDDSTRNAAYALEQADSRVRFFDFPKGHRRGERNRHAVLQEARGRIVCYMSDRDLWLPNHVEVMDSLLASSDFAAATGFDPGALHAADRATYPPRVVYPRDPENRIDRRHYIASRGGLPLSCTSHTLAAYRALPWGWRDTPEGVYTDQYMWAQFMNQSWCRGAISYEPTVLYFKREHHPGWATPRRLEESRLWFGRLKDRQAIDGPLVQALLATLPAAAAARRGPEELILIRGRSPARLLRRILERLGVLSR